MINEVIEETVAPITVVINPKFWDVAFKPRLAPRPESVSWEAGFPSNDPYDPDQPLAPFWLIITLQLALLFGTRLGSYEIVAPIGAGGMGEVYRAKDTTLDRLVAIKVMPESFALDADRVTRFTREAKTLAALNHPNIAAIFGFEKTPDLMALVMELVEGEDLSVIIARGPIPLLDALPMARQIAEAPEAAKR